MSITADLNTMPLAELKALKGRIDRAISEFDDRRRQAAMLALAETARSHGFTLVDLLGEASTAVKQPRAPAVAKYADPKDPSRTWSGRGKRPRWFRAALDAGISDDAMRIS